MADGKGAASEQEPTRMADGKASAHEQGPTRIAEGSMRGFAESTGSYHPKMAGKTRHCPIWMAQIGLHGWGRV